LLIASTFVNTLIVSPAIYCGVFIQTEVFYPGGDCLAVARMATVYVSRYCQRSAAISKYLAPKPVLPVPLVPSEVEGSKVEGFTPLEIKPCPLGGVKSIWQGWGLKPIGVKLRKTDLLKK